MLTIKDLSASKELDRAAMASVRGGRGPSFPGVKGDDFLNSYNKYDIWNDYYVDASVDITKQTNIGAINNLAGPGSVSIPMLAQNNED